MNYTEQEVMQFAEEEDVKFIRLAFCDVFGKPKNVSIMKDELKRAFQIGIAIDGSAIVGFGDEAHSDLFLHPDPNTLSVLPWRPEHGRVVRMYCTISYPDGTPFVADTRKILAQAVETAKKEGIAFRFGTEIEFYLFKLDEFGNKTNVPYDNAGYMDVSPDDKGENIRREICLTLEQMGIYPESSHHEEGPGQNEIDFRESEPVTAADNMVHYKTVVKSIAAQNGLFASFMPKPLPNEHGSALSILLSLKKNGEQIFGSSTEDMSHEGKCFISGVLERIREITAFLNPTTNSYKRFGIGYAPKYVDWSFENRSQLIRIPRTAGLSPRIELRSADACCNPYITFRLILAAGIEGIRSGNCSILESTLNHSSSSELEPLPHSLEEACKIAQQSDFVRRNLPDEILSDIFAQLEKQIQEYNLARNKDEFEENYYFKFV